MNDKHQRGTEADEINKETYTLEAEFWHLMTNEREFMIIYIIHTCIVSHRLGDDGHSIESTDGKTAMNSQDTAKLHINVPTTFFFFDRDKSIWVGCQTNKQFPVHSPACTRTENRTTAALTFLSTSLSCRWSWRSLPEYTSRWSLDSYNTNTTAKFISATGRKYSKYLLVPASLTS